MATKVFISYRRVDASYPADRIYQAFKAVLGPSGVFMDVDTIRPGRNFRKTLKDWVDQCTILLALIGPHWIDATDPDTGLRRIDDSNDFVRIEISEALARDIDVVPILLDGTPMPGSNLLPEEMKELADRQAVAVRRLTFDHDVAQLIYKLGFDGARFDVSRPILKAERPSDSATGSQHPLGTYVPPTDASPATARSRDPIGPLLTPPASEGGDTDEEVAKLFRRLREAFRDSREGLAIRLKTTPDVIEIFERGDIASLPHWPETKRVLRNCCELLGLDPRPLLDRINELHLRAWPSKLLKHYTPPASR